MEPFFIIYMALWGLACLAALVFMFHTRHSLELFQRSYWVGLLQGWKVATFLVAATGMTVMAPYTGDPTWDYFDAAYMSLLSFTTAPWAISTLYLALRGRRPVVNAYIAACVWMFSASWSYDLYMVFKFGDYPFTWLPNIFASSVLYICAGLMWNLEVVEGRGVIFGFMDSNWPSVPKSVQKTKAINRILAYALPFMILVAAMILPFIF